MAHSPSPQSSPAGAGAKSATGATVLKVNGVTKRFGSVTANQNVNFDLHKGEIHALVGENGAGKTTLMRILYGMYQPDAGSIAIDGATVRFAKPMDSIRHGIGMVHQHFMLVPSFTVAENVTLGAEPGRGGWYSHAAAAESLADPMARLGIRLDPKAIVGDLNVATQQKLEIMKVLYRGARIIILDEPTAVLTPQETEELFILLRKLADDGSSIIFISHKLREVFAIADRITVLRNGKTVITQVATETTAAEVVAAMTGRKNVSLGRMEHTNDTNAPVVLEVAGLSTGPQGHDASLEGVGFQIRAGEILAVAGVEGNGQSVLAETLIGTIQPSEGSILLDGEDMATNGVSERRERGVSYVPEDRHLEGIPINGTVLEGLAAGRLRARNAVQSFGNAFPPAMRAWASELVDRYSVKTAGIDARCSTLSGGNQQKVVLARELEELPKLLILAQPTRGVDLGAIEFMYEQVAEATRRGCAVLLISADLDEILRFADRVIVMYDGKIVAEEIATETTAEQLGMHMTGITTGAAS
ncbi:ABC transporter ATP-binding protein [Homoserinimonas sp. OAct 916]|uniref:ABC transporter ATP-binding protein n=1 Tax=Homoserinimonas sp. OAct 916 TaxID=2211450 RepID=UPI0018E51211|nr:ABC transporter ATP-binding protein [Homoserinimonas sp. OAct 916]